MFEEDYGKRKWLQQTALILHTILAEQAIKQAYSFPGLQRRGPALRCHLAHQR
jgi:hypothetical protein